MLAGCGTIALPNAPVSPPPTNYRQLAANAAAVYFKTVPLVGAQISELREAKAPQLGEFAACLRTVAPSSNFAVLYEGAKVIDIRRAVVVDRCGEGDFGPLPAPVVVAKTDVPVPEASKKRPWR